MASPRRLLVQTDRTIDSHDWASRHRTGQLPGGLPYGLDLLSGHGFRVEHRPPLTGAGARLAAKGLRGLGNRWDWWGARRIARSADTDINLCWDERSGIPTAALGNKSAAPVITGVIWLTDQAATLPAPFRRLARSAFARSDAVWALSSAQLAPLEHDFGIPRRKLFRLGFGIDTGFWMSDPEPASPEQTTVLAVGNDRDRDHESVVRSVAVARTRAEATLHLVTSTGVEVPKELGRVTDRLTHSQLRHAYKQAAVVVMAARPNTHVSGMTTILEAQAMGRPVVATRTPGVEDYLIDGVTGVLVEPGDAEAIGRAVGDLLADPARREQMGRAGREFVCAHASAESQAAQLAEIIGTAT